MEMNFAQAVTESKVILLEQETASLFGKPAVWEDDRLLSQRTVLSELEFRLLSY